MTAFRATLPYKSYRFSGDDAMTFLQGQLTQDMQIITPNTCHYGAYCDVKGRMLANFLLCADAAGYILRMHEAQADAVIKRLKMFVLRAKVIVEELAFMSIGLNLAGAQALCEANNLALPEAFATVAHEDFILCALPHGYYELIPFSELALSNLSELNTEESLDTVETCRLSGGHFNVLPETYESIFPQQTALETWGAINYRKGCYVGQEVIARNKYRGKVKKGMGYALLNKSLDLPALTTIQRDGKAIGQIIESHQNNDSTACLAVMAIDALGEDVSVEGCSTCFQPIA